MTKLKKAQDLYLRGFHGSYIRRRTGLFWTDVKKSLDDGSKEAIVRYQAAYIYRKFTEEQIREAWSKLEADKVLSSWQASQGRLIVLGCQFGQYQRVFRRIFSHELIT